MSCDNQPPEFRGAGEGRICIKSNRPYRLDLIIFQRLTTFFAFRRFSVCAWRGQFVCRREDKRPASASANSAPDRTFRRKNLRRHLNRTDPPRPPVPPRAPHLPSCQKATHTPFRSAPRRTADMTSTADPTRPGAPEHPNRRTFCIGANRSALTILHSQRTLTFDILRLTLPPTDQTGGRSRAPVRHLPPCQH